MKNQDTDVAASRRSPLILLEQPPTRDTEITPTRDQPARSRAEPTEPGRLLRPLLIQFS